MIAAEINAYKWYKYKYRLVFRLLSGSSRLRDSSVELTDEINRRQMKLASNIFNSIKNIWPNDSVSLATSTIIIF